MPMSNALGNSILNYFYNVGTPIMTAPTKVYLGLSTTIINADGTGITEPVGNGYVRMELNANTTMFTTSTVKELSNKNGIIFPKVTGGNWNTHTNTAADVLYAFISTASTGGIMLWYQQVPYKWIQAGTEYYIAVGSLDFSIV